MWIRWDFTLVTIPLAFLFRFELLLDHMLRNILILHRWSFIRRYPIRNYLDLAYSRLSVLDDGLLGADDCSI